MLMFFFTIFLTLGIGFYTALDFAKRNARVILACRDEQKGETARQQIISISKNKNVVVGLMDLCSMKSVTEFANKIKKEENRLDILVNNAGVVCKCVLVLNTLKSELLEICLQKDFCNLHNP